MSIEIRYASEDEYPALAELDGASFGFSYDEETLEDGRTELHLDRVLVATDAGRIVGVSAELPLEVTLPGGRPVPSTGLTWVSVDVTHRRRGIVRSLIERQIRASADAGDTAVLLYASEGGIYGRFGFGNATVFRRTVVDRRRAQLAAPAGEASVRRLSSEEARPLLPGIHDRWRRSAPGALSRDDQRWRLLLGDRESKRKGGSALQHLVHEDGYVSYRFTSKWEQGRPDGDCEILDYVAITPQAHAALWQTLLGLDLAARIASYRLPPDDPLPLRLTDPRAVDVTHWADGMWVRPTRVTTLLGGRCYPVEIDCVLSVRDPLLGDAAYRLRGGPEGSTCERTSAPADVELPVAAVGMLSLGGVRFGRLVWAGLADCADPALVRRLDLALTADREPFPGTQF